MRRHVIKGRGPNRGKYLCYARMDPALTPTEDGFVWLPEQRKAARWDAPTYNRGTWETSRAAKHNGYFVKLVCPEAIKSRVRELLDFICGHAAGAKDAVRGYWFDGDFHDSGEDFCRACAEKLVDEQFAADPARFRELYGDDCENAEDRYRAAIDGGFDIDHDSPRWCETCDVKLSGNLTDHGADEEITALTGGHKPTFDDVEGWTDLEQAVCNLSDDDPRWRKIARVVDAARLAEARHHFLTSPEWAEARRNA